MRHPGGRKKPRILWLWTCFSHDCQILVLALAPLNPTVPPLLLRMPLDCCLLNPGCMQVTHDKRHNCTLWSCLLHFSVSKFLLGLEDMVQYFLLPTHHFLMFYKDRSGFCVENRLWEAGSLDKCGSRESI